jgi:hypothetical protein
MKDIQDLENNESILLMYLAGELPPQDHAEVEQMVMSDPNLREQLSSLQQMQQQVNGALKELDSVTCPPLPATFAEAEICRMIQQWHGERERRKRTLIVPRRAVMPRIWLGLAAAASIAIGYLVWGAYHPPITPPGPRLPDIAADDEKLNLMGLTMTVSDGIADTEMQVAAAMASSDDLDGSTDSGGHTDTSNQ